jgi:NAD(P)-dependent dehydrogenase (short-subunit alcohol dehydrogenase family)
MFKLDGRVAPAVGGGSGIGRAGAIALAAFARAGSSPTSMWTERRKSLP